MINEDLAKEVISKGVHVTERGVTFAIQMAQMPSRRSMMQGMGSARNRVKAIHGEMTGKQILQKDQGVQKIDIDKAGLRDFRKIARRYGVDFAIVKSTNLDPPVYTCFFKGRDQDAIDNILRDYGAKTLDMEKKPSVVKKLHDLVKEVAKRPRKVKERYKENVR